jgi:hypothetical protein
VFSLDIVAATLAGMGIKSDMVTVQGLFDSAAVVDIAPLSDTAMPLANMTAAAYALVNASGATSPACAAAFPAEQQWRCLLGGDALAHVTTPYLLAQSQFDRAQLMYNAPRPGSTAASAAYADAFQSASLAMLDGVPSASQPKSALFSPACFSFCTSLSANFWNVMVQGAPRRELGIERTPVPASLQDTLNWWFFKGSVRQRRTARARRGVACAAAACCHDACVRACVRVRVCVCAQHNVRVVDDCTGFRCGAPPLSPPFPALTFTFTAPTAPSHARLHAC